VERAVLPNGLRVVTMPDPAAPLVAVSVIYDVGFRSEPEGRTGFAHLFEHMMFQGSAHVGKGEHPRLVESAGGVLNGSTLADLTLYYEALPPSGLELALFLEADRMSSLAVTEENLRNQVDVVKEEIRVNVLNRPYGGFPWISLPALAFDSFANAHNGYGDFTHLERSTVEDCKDFYGTYYSPSNAVLAVVGPVDADKVVGLAEQYFGPIRRRRVPKRGPWPEPPLAADRHRVLSDPLAPQPALAVGYRTVDPLAQLDRYLAYCLLAGVLSDGDASRLRSRLVYRDRLVTDIGCQLGTFGADAFFVRDPTLFQVVAYHPGVATGEELVRVVDQELARLAGDGPDADELRRVVATSSADLWRSLGSIPDRAVTLGAVEAVHGRAELVYELASRLGEVRAADVATAAAALHGQHRALLEVAPAAGER
jgi:zinc protease